MSDRCDKARTLENGPVAGPVDHPVRPDSEAWVRQWFAEHYEAGDVFEHSDCEGLTLRSAVAFATAVCQRMTELCALDIAAATLQASRLAQTAERERCAVVCETIGKDIVCPEECASAIRGPND